MSTLVYILLLGIAEQKAITLDFDLTLFPKWREKKKHRMVVHNGFVNFREVQSGSIIAGYIDKYTKIYISYTIGQARNAISNIS